MYTLRSGAGYYEVMADADTGRRIPVGYYETKIDGNCFEIIGLYPAVLYSVFVNGDADPVAAFASITALDNWAKENMYGAAASGGGGGASGDVTVVNSAAEKIPVDVKNTSLSVSMLATELHLGQTGGNTLSATAEFTRPADTTAYTALDVVSNSTSAPSVLTFANLARVAAGSGYITKARLMTDQKGNTARYKLHLFHTAPTAVNDNSAYAMLWANRANRIGTITFDAMATEDATGSTAAGTSKTDIRIGYLLASGRAVYGILETLDAFTPASEQNFYIELISENN